MPTTTCENKNLKQLVRDDIFIGKGGFGYVFGPCSWKDKICAVKRRMYGEMENCKKEHEACKFWMSVRHKNLISVYLVSFESPALYMLMEYGSGGALRTVLERRRSSALPVEILMDWSIQVAEGMAHLHRNNIVHRDLKSANVIIMEPDAVINPYGKTLKIIDFDQIREFDHTTVMSFIGTFAWMAPEIFESGHFSKASDVWSYGVVLWEMSTREVPYEDIACQTIPFNVLNRTCKLTVPDLCPDSITTVMELCQRYERGERPTFDSILSTLNYPRYRRSKLSTENEETSRSINGLPFELLDIILMRSYHYYVSSKKQSMGKDEFIIQQLASVDFCWFQRLTGRKLKQRIWRHISDKKVAILENNKSFITENIQPKGLIKQMRSADCVSDIEARLICRIQSKKSLFDKSELIHAVRLFDDAQLSSFVQCLCQLNQQLLARIEENGGVVVKTSIRALDEKGRPLLQRNLVQAFNDLRDKSIPRSPHTDILISELKDVDIEILNSVLDKQIVVWIWCKSETGLIELQKRNKSNGLIDMFTGLSSFSETAKSAVVSVCTDQFNKNVAVREPTIKLTASLGVGTLIKGVTKLRNKIYVLCQSDNFSPTEIWVFQDQNLFHLQTKFDIKECELSYDIVSSERRNCLYISDFFNKCIWKIEPTQEKVNQYKAIKWFTSEHKPYTMSMCSDGKLLIIERSDLSFLGIYGPDTGYICSIPLPDVKCHHAVETSTGNFIIIGECKEEQMEDSPPRSDDRQSKWIIYHLTRDGQMIIRSSVLPSETQEVKNPWYLSLYSDDRVFVAASKVNLLNSNLKTNLTVYNKTQTTGLNRSFYDDEKKQLIVSGITKEVYVYTLTLK